MMRRTKKDRYFAMYKGDKYVDYGPDGFDIYECKKCGKHKTEEGTWLGYTGPMK